MQSSKSHFAITMKRLREEKGLSMSQLAKELNTTKSSVNMWENGNAIPREQTLVKISNYFNVSIDHLYGLDKKDLQLQRVQQLQKKTNIRAEKLKVAIDKLKDEELDKLAKTFVAIFGDEYQFILENPPSIEELNQKLEEQNKINEEA